MGLFRRRETASTSTTPPAGPLETRLAALVAARADVAVWTPPAPVTRTQAMSLSVIQRSRDLMCGVLSRMPFRRYSDHGLDPTGDEPRLVAAGWLDRPDPTRTRGSFVADITDDLFFYGWGAARITSRSADGFPNALERLEWIHLTPPQTHRAGTPGAGDVDDWLYRDPATGQVRKYLDVNVIVFESPVTGVLEAPNALGIAARLDRAAARFATTSIPAGWLRQTGGVPLSAVELAERAEAFEVARETHTIAALNEYLDYEESTIDPSRLQLVEGRQFQDAALARIANVPGFMVGAVIPGDSMTYRTAATARLDLVDFGLAPLIGAWEETLSGPDVTPRGQHVRMDPSPFLRTLELAAVNDTPIVAPAATPGAAR